MANNDSGPKSCFLLRVHGVVQGVGYRSLVASIAKKHGILGYVKNMEDGSVEVKAFGTAADLELFMEEINVSYDGGPSVFSIEKTLAPIDNSSPSKFETVW